ncbi:MAG: hypothetical protein PVJ39_03165 [Gammaproteobacteria bacterium]|jgi:hypothetical protein
MAVAMLAIGAAALAGDADHDGISDMEETTIYKTDMHLPDTDTDGLNDGLEVEEYFTDPRIADTDGDGFLDGVEAINDSDPTDSDSKPVSQDLDHDGLSNVQEQQQGTDPQRVDTDFDGLNDREEIEHYFTDPKLVDTDGDSYWDGEEVTAGTDPGDPASHPVKAVK